MATSVFCGHPWPVPQGRGRHPGKLVPRHPRERPSAPAILAYALLPRRRPGREDAASCLRHPWLRPSGHPCPRPGFLRPHPCGRVALRPLCSQALARCCGRPRSFAVSACSAASGFACRSPAPGLSPRKDAGALAAYQPRGTGPGLRRPPGSSLSLASDHASYDTM